MSETLVFVSPLAALDARLPSLGDKVSRIWEEEWRTMPAEQVIQVFVRAAPDVVVIGPGVDEEGVIEWITALEHHRPDIAVVLVADQKSGLLLQALRAGVADVIPPNVSQTELANALERAREVARRRSATGATRSDGGDRNRVVALMSPKGGTGKTMLATSLSLVLTERIERGEVGLVDLDIQFGGVASALGLLAEHTIGDAATAARVSLDSTTLKVFLTRFGQGTYVLASPASLVEAEEVHAEHMKAVLHHFSELFPWTVVDTPSGIGEPLLVTLEHATDLLLVTTPDVASVRALRRAVEALDLVGMMTAERHLVINRFDSRAALSRDEIESIVGQPAIGTIPPSRFVPQAMDAGHSVLESPKDPAVRALREIADVFHADNEPDARGGRFRRKGR